MRRIPVGSALRFVFAAPRGVAAFLVASAGIFALFVLVPVWSTPGNDIAFQLSIMTPVVYAVMIALSLLNGLVIAMQLHVRRHGVKGKAHAETGGMFGAFGASLLATVGCAACYSSVLALFGLSGTIFIVEHRFWFAALAAALALFAIAKSSQRIVRGCETACRI